MATTVDLEQWTDKVALVTGASSGIGHAIATRLVDGGMRVAGCGRDAAAMQRLREKLGGRFLPIVCDLRDEGSILEMFATVDTAFGGVDVLVNNAGLGHASPLCSGQTEHWREMLEVNVLALCICTREAVQRMHHRGGPGHVLHISSMAAHRTPPGSGVYSATKFAVRALTEALRQELNERNSPVRVTALSPGFVETRFAERYHKTEDAAATTYGAYPVLQPADVADAVAWALEQPPHVQIHDVLMRPTRQPR